MLASFWGYLVFGVDQYTPTPPQKKKIWLSTIWRGRMQTLNTKKPAYLAGSLGLSGLCWFVNWCEGEIRKNCLTVWGKKEKNSDSD